MSVLSDYIEAEWCWAEFFPARREEMDVAGPRGDVFAMGGSALVEDHEGREWPMNFIWGREEVSSAMHTQVIWKDLEDWDFDPDDFPKPEEGSE